MEDGDIKLHESLAIMRYLMERYGELCGHLKRWAEGSDGVCHGINSAE